MMDDTATAASDQARDSHLEAEQAIRRLHDEWFDASAAKDLDRSMAPIAATIVSYKHSSPLQFDDIALIREECRRASNALAMTFDGRCQS